MSKESRTRILAGLSTAVQSPKISDDITPEIEQTGWSQQQKIETLKKHLEAARSEVIFTPRHNRIETLTDLIRRKKIGSLLYSAQVSLGKEILSTANSELQQILKEYSGDEAANRELLFEVDASITTAKGGIAENGAIILWPDEHEPRMMSLVPPVHIIVLEADTIFESFQQAIQEGNWPAQMPTNAVLISGPSRTADIELVLAFGVHGPKEVIVVISE